VEEWARLSKFFDALDELQQKLDEVASTDFRKVEGGQREPS
jgi:hypothetical protein